MRCGFVAVALAFAALAVDLFFRGLRKKNIFPSGDMFFKGNPQREQGTLEPATHHVSLPNRTTDAAPWIFIGSFI